MVSSTTVKSNEEESIPKLPAGKYRVIGFDLDLTGRRLIDEICHIAAYTPYSQFSQYVMPFKDLNYKSKQMHRLRVVTVGKYRMLKCDKTGKILKTKSEISAVTDFVQWLEGLPAEGIEGIILVTHDALKKVPPFLLEVLGKYDLLDRFNAVVKGFANSFLFAQQKCDKPVGMYTLYNLSKVLLEKDEGVHSAADRARLSYQIVQHLCTGEDDKGSGDATSTPDINSPAMSEAIRLIATNYDDEKTKLDSLKELVERQNSLRPIFGVKFSSRFRDERFRASSLRRLITEANLTYDNLAEAWNKDKESLVALVKERVTTARKPEDIDDLTETLLCHFDPQHVPKVQNVRRRRNTKSQSEGGAEAAGDAKADKSKSPGDKTSKTSSGKSSPGKFASATSSPVKSPNEKTDEDTSR